MTIRRTLRLARASGLNPAATLVGGFACFVVLGIALLGVAIVAADAAPPGCGPTASAACGVFAKPHPISQGETK